LIRAAFDELVQSVQWAAIITPMAERRKKRPRDSIQLAKLIGDIATGQVEDREECADNRNPHAVALGRLGGLKGGPARAKTMPAERRSEVAHLAAKKRWSRGKPTP
jgi:hypothetical protein